MDESVSVARAIRATHESVLAAVDRRGTEVTREWPADGLGDGRRAATDLDTAFRAEGILERLPPVLETAAATLGTAPVADPVAAPPYVVVTSRGPVLRATLPRWRVVLTLAVVTIETGRYHPREDITLEVACPDRRTGPT
ncbi:MAG: hypothetical protein ABEJ57_06980 [Halobacteriaceae archaeon]